MPAEARRTQADVSFDRSPWEDRMAKKAAQRARAMEVAHSDGGKPRAISDWWMDIIATHANGNPLDFDKLLAADDFNFAHDVFGICRHLNRETGELEDFFSPRCSLRVAEASA